MRSIQPRGLNACSRRIEKHCFAPTAQPQHGYTIYLVFFTAYIVVLFVIFFPVLCLLFYSIKLNK